MANTLAFQSTTFDIVDRNGQPWLKAAQISKALGYSRADAIGRIYERNRAEFTATMTDTVKLTVSGNLETESRIFSLRGAHLLGMFARTKVAADFRRWVLDVLDTQVQQQPALDPKRAGFYKALEASNGLASAVQIAAMQALMEGGQLKAGRWVMNINEHEGFGRGVHVKPMPLNAIMAAPEDWPRLIAEPNGNYFSKETLTLIMNACLNKLLDYLDCTQQANEMLRTELKRRKALPALKGGQA